MEKIYSNMAACHVKNGNWKRAIETADKVHCITPPCFSSPREICEADFLFLDQALVINPKNYKALFRKSKALGEQGYFEKAEKILLDILQNSPPGI